MRKIAPKQLQKLTLNETISIYEKENPTHKAKYTTEIFEKAEDFLYSEKYLYLIESESGLTKIGISQAPKRRLRQIKISGFDAKIIALFMPEPTFDLEANYLEKILHKFFKVKRKFGEWFNLTKNDIELIKESLCDLLTYENGGFSERI